MGHGSLYSLLIKILMAYKSQFEVKIDRELRLQGVDFEYETVELAYMSVYKPDFILPNGIIIEAKGYFKKLDRAKMIKVKRNNPRCDIRFVFQRADNVVTGSKTRMTYGQWATKHGFPWASGTIPKAWIDEKGTN